MIDENAAKHYCSEPLENIENYDMAMADSKHTWHCHHRNEICEANRSRSDKGITTKAQLIADGMYYHRPASELIFLPHSEHSRLHVMGNKRSLGHKQTLKGKLINRPDLSKQVKMTRLADGFTKVFPSHSEAARWLRENGYPKATSGRVSECVNGHRKTACGATWAYAN